MQEAKTLLAVALPTYAHHLRGLEFEKYEADSRFYFFTVLSAAPARSSVVVGNYAVDIHTGKVWSAVSGCDELSNPRLRRQQLQIRSELGLTQSEYKRIKTHGPLCDQ